ncbi:MAG: hypothetical protein AAF266_12150, partial [Planctomycetota bacterium]
MRAASKKKIAPIASATAALREGAVAKAKPTSSRFTLRRESHGRMSSKEVTLVLRNLATLTSNGVSLPKAIGALSEEKAL